MNLVLRKKEIEDRLTEIRGMVEKEEDMKKLEEMEKVTDKLQEERSMIEKKMSLTKMTEIPMISTKNNAEQRDLLEKRGKDLMENRIIKVSSDEVLLPEHVDSNLAPYPFKPVSELVDRVHTINLQGGETWLRNAIRVIIWKQWKTTDRRMQALIQLGLSKNEAKCVSNSRKGYQQICHCW